MNRIQFIQQSAYFLAASLLACRSINRPDREKQSVCSFDMHTHPGAFFRKGSAEYDGDLAFINRVKNMNDSGLNGAFFSIVSDFPLLQLTDKGIKVNGSFDRGEAWQLFKTQLKILKD